MNWGVIEPFLVVDCVINRDHGMQEQGAAPLTMIVNSYTNLLLQNQIGLQAYQDEVEEWGVTIFREKAAYVNKAYFGSENLSAAIVGLGGSFTFLGFTEMQNLLRIELEMLLKRTNGLYGSLEYDGEFCSGYLSNSVQGKIGIYF